MQEKTTLTVSLPRSLKSSLEALAQREQRTLSNFVRILLQELVSPADANQNTATKRADQN
jgi:metal-responsive CopG/Arc/MetJ family transcriptional regulator